MISLLLFYEPIIGSSWAMHSCMFLSPVDVLLGQSAIFGLALASVALLGLVGGADSPPIFFLVCPSRLDVCPIVGLFILKRCTSNTLAFQKNLEYSAPFLRVPLLIFGVRRIPEEDLKFPEIFLTVSA